MNTESTTQLVPAERIERLIHLARGEKVMLDADLAKLYGVSTGAMNRAVRRNASRFPQDFMFQLSAEEAEILKCQIGISSSGHGGRRRSLPFAFTEQGVAMLSSVLRSERAVPDSDRPKATTTGSWMRYCESEGADFHHELNIEPRSALLSATEFRLLAPLQGALFFKHFTRGSRCASTPG